MRCNIVIYTIKFDLAIAVSGVLQIGLGDL